MNRIINKIKNQYKFAVYIDKNGNKNTNISIDKNNITFKYAHEALQLLYQLANGYLQNNSIKIKPPQYNYNTYFNNIEAGLCGDSFINCKGDRIDIEFHVKQFDPDTEKQVLQQFKKQYKNKFKNLPLSDLLNIEEQLGNYIINNFYLGVIMIFINGEYKTEEHQCYHRNKTSQLKNIGNKLINEYKQQYL